MYLRSDSLVLAGGDDTALHSTEDRGSSCLQPTLRRGSAHQGQGTTFVVSRAEHDGLTPLVIVDHGLEVLDELVVLDDIVEVGDGVVSMAGVVNTLTMT